VKVRNQHVHDKPFLLLKKRTVCIIHLFSLSVKLSIFVCCGTI
jgi:hypothetical protein